MTSAQVCSHGQLSYKVAFLLLMHLLMKLNQHENETLSREYESHISGKHKHFHPFLNKVPVLWVLVNTGSWFWRVKLDLDGKPCISDRYLNATVLIVTWILVCNVWHSSQGVVEYFLPYFVQNSWDTGFSWSESDLSINLNSGLTYPSQFLSCQTTVNFYSPLTHVFR